MFKNWKTVEYTNQRLYVKGDEEPVLKYDPRHDETVNIITGEIITK